MILVPDDANDIRLGQFLFDLVTDAARHKVKLSFINKDWVGYGKIKSTGFFEDSTPELRIATGRPLGEWLPILIHERCHMDQWAEKAKVWNDLTMGKTDSITIIEDWLAGKRRPNIEKAIRISQKLEWDCENRTVAAMRKYGFDEAAIREYTMGANAYIYSYSVLLKRRKWIPGIYRKEAITSTCPDYFLPFPKYKSLPVGIQKAFDEVYNEQ